MNAAVKKELAKACAPVVTRVLQVGAEYHFDKKRLKIHEQHQIEKTERRRENMEKLSEMSAPTTPDQGQQQAQANPAQAEQAAEQAVENAARQPETVPVDPGPNVYQALRELRQQTTCGFCHRTLEMAENEGPDVAKEAYREIAEFKRRKDELLAQGVSQDEMEAELEAMADEWTVTPQLWAGTGGGGRGGDRRV